MVMVLMMAVLNSDARKHPSSSGNPVFYLSDDDNDNETTLDDVGDNASINN